MNKRKVKKTHRSGTENRTSFWEKFCLHPLSSMFFILSSIRITVKDALFTLPLVVLFYTLLPPFPLPLLAWGPPSLWKVPKGSPTHSHLRTTVIKVKKRVGSEENVPRKSVEWMGTTKKKAEKALCSTRWLPGCTPQKGTSLRISPSLLRASMHDSWLQQVRKQLAAGELRQW